MQRVAAAPRVVKRDKMGRVEGVVIANGSA